MSFANTGIRHAAIAMANVGARAVHAGIRMLRAQALSIRTSTHGQGLAALTKDIPISTTGLFGGDLSKAEAKATHNFPQLPTTSHNFPWLWPTVLFCHVF